MMMSQFAQKFTRLGRDGYNLARAMVRNRGSDVKPLLLDYARQSNSVATSLLNVDKQVGLIQYHGLSSYIKQRLQSTSANTETGGKGDGENPPSPKDGAVVKIAFMVTASMKQELAELGYDPDVVKALSPLQATLILKHAIAPEDMPTRLPLAEAEYEERRQSDEAEALAKAQQQQQQQQQQPQQQSKEMAAVEDPQPTSTTTTAATSLDWGSNTTQFFGTDHGYGSRNELEARHNANIGAFFNASEWFEVTETNSKGQTSRIGLYQDEEEARIGLETRRDIAEAKSTNQKFDMHRIDWKDLQ